MKNSQKQVYQNLIAIFRKKKIFTIVNDCKIIFSSILHFLIKRKITVQNYIGQNQTWNCIFQHRNRPVNVNERYIFLSCQYLHPDVIILSTKTNENFFHKNLHSERDCFFTVFSHIHILYRTLCNVSNVRSLRCGKLIEDHVEATEFANWQFVEKRIARVDRPTVSTRDSFAFSKTRTQERPPADFIGRMAITHGNSMSVIG